ncbi:hypothetical protein LHYA1_G005966 [Lachnellula hyalina]|uniref:Uncharacterized protein n=1 Tax=Lachnellula hyalina TaxID=1316788 RepID=A0A8H8QZ29_9HELO|nr:uncharacterized protein LHYA1_G005966 [Lachnellula hyalina]TVY25111.1 hypothetical protein LHYA1_G005966 [Lachnellula hyalina]
MSTTKQTAKTSVENLPTAHLSAFKRTLSGILSTTLAERTFAQIIDGLPTRDDNGYFPTYSTEIRDNTASSAEAMEGARELLRGHINAYTTLVDAKLAQAYQDARPGSVEFYLRLLEMLAVACHDIAALVYGDTQPGLRRAGQSAQECLAALEGRPTDFMHEDYCALQQYPRGVADVAEYHLFGGVVLFDRGGSGTDCKRAFLHPVGGFRIFQISSTHIKKFAEYVQASEDTQEALFPFSAEKYTYRVDPFDAMALNIYRDRYERVIPRDRPTRCVQRLADFPELQDALVQINRDGSDQ